LSYRIIGFSILTIGIISGAVWANEAWGAYWSWDPKETWALITWLVFIFIYIRFVAKGWQGQKPLL
jgi:ABC-type transport system involved in cytochrome c biogenesis permease subunit